MTLAPTDQRASAPATTFGRGGSRQAAGMPHPASGASNITLATHAPLSFFFVLYHRT